MTDKIADVIKRYPNTEADQWRQVKGAWVHKDCVVSEGVDIRGGVLRGGTFYGGTFYGGTFYGGTFNKGWFHDGTFRGGEFRGGAFLDGEFRGGTFRGGTFGGGRFFGGSYHYGTFEGGTWKRSPLLVKGTMFSVCESDNGYITSGCMRMPSEWWTPKNIRYAAKRNDYTDEQVEEYLQIFEFVKSRMELTGPVVD